MLYTQPDRAFVLDAEAAAAMLLPMHVPVPPEDYSPPNGATPQHGLVQQQYAYNAQQVQQLLLDAAYTPSPYGVVTPKDLVQPPPQEDEPDEKSPVDRLAAVLGANATAAALTTPAAAVAGDGLLARRGTAVATNGSAAGGSAGAVGAAEAAAAAAPGGSGQQPGHRLRLGLPGGSMLAQALLGADDDWESEDEQPLGNTEQQPAL